MGTLLLTLFSVAAAIALDRTLDRYYEKKNNLNKVSSDDIIAVTNSMINEARQKGEDTLRQLGNRLSNIQFPLGMSASVKDFITNARNKISKQNETATRDISAVEKKLSDVQERSANLAAQSTDYKRMYGQEKLNQIKDDAQNALNRMSEIQKGVETNV